MVQWFTDNVARLRPVGSHGNNFNQKRLSHGPMHTTSKGIGGFGERKFSGFSTKTSMLTPSKAQETAIRLMQPLQLAKQALQEHRRQ